MSWINLNEAIGLRHCCFQGSSIEPIAIDDTSAAIVNIPLGVRGVNSDEDLYQISDGGVMVKEAGLYLISGSVYYVNGESSITRGAYIRTNNNTELSQAYYYEPDSFNTGAIGLAPKVVSLSADTILYLAGRARKKEGDAVNPLIYPQNSATFLTIVKVA